MKDRNEITGNDAAIEEILRQAPPRPTPSDDDIAGVRAVVESEWRSVTSRRRARHRLAGLAAAASIVVAVSIGIALLNSPSAIPVHVATIEKTTGTIYMLGERSELHETADLSEVLVGQTLGTGDDSGVALAWLDGGSLRIDEDSRVEFVSPTEIYLHAGQVYYDSEPFEVGDAPGSSRAFETRTREGIVRHVGTQYMTGIASTGMTVSVREGAVTVAGGYHDARATAGESVLFNGTDNPVFIPVSPHGPAWRWAEQLAPAARINSPHEFVHWVARETGLQVHYASAESERIARDAEIFGDATGMEPRKALILLETAGLEARIENGVISISER